MAGYPEGQSIRSDALNWHPPQTGTNSIKVLRAVPAFLPCATFVSIQLNKELMSNASAASLLAASAVLMGISNLCLKTSVGRGQAGAAALSFIFSVVRQPIFICGFIMFGLASLLYMRVLTSIPLSTAYPVFVSIAFAIVAIGAMMLFGERLTSFKLLGSAFLIAGIFFISRG